MLRVHGQPGDFTRLFTGRTPTVQPTPGVAIEHMLGKLRTVDLGSQPAQGFIDDPFPQLGVQTPGTPLLTQATTTSSVGQLERTNSTPLVVEQT